MSDANAAPKQPEIDKVYANVYKVLKEYGISAAAQDDYNLRVTHKTNKFMIHTIHKAGYISPKPVEVEGPNYDGLIVEARVGMGQYAGQAEIPQELKRTYWTTFINAYSIDRGKSHLYLSISFREYQNYHMNQRAIILQYLHKY